MNKKEQIRKAAVKVIAKEGYYNTSVKVIAKEAGVAVGTVYNYFSNKKEILAYIFEKEFDKRIKWLQKLKEEELSFKEKLKFFLNQHFEELKIYPDVTKVLMQEGRPPSKHRMKEINNFMEKLPNLFAQMIEEANKKNEIRGVDSQLIANTIFHAIRGMVIKVTNDSEYDFPQAKRELLNLLWIGLEK